MFIKLQIGIVILFVLGIVFIFGKQKRKEKPLVVGLVICTLISAFISNAILGLIPLPTNEVIVTALGEKNEAAKKDEVSIISYLVGGKEYEIKNPTEGKWFWKGDTYMWRNESDSRQPAGTTRSITLNIPYGKDRYIQFGRSQWNGLVAVTYDGETTEYDLYKQSNETTVCAIVPDTNIFFLYGTNCLRLILYLALIIIIIFYPIYCATKYDKSSIYLFANLEKHWDKMAYFIISLLSFAFMVMLGWDNHKIWVDEISNVGWIYNTSLERTIITNASMIDVSPPLFNMIAYFWIKIMPYGFEYLFLLCELLMAFSVYLTGITAAQVKDKFTGVIAAILMGFSPAAIIYIGFEFRPAPLLLFTASLTFYLYFKKISQSTVDLKMLIGLSIAYTVLALSHYYGILIVLSLFLIDSVQFVKKRIKINYFIPYLVFGAIETIWFVLVCIFTQRNFSDSWKSPPSIGTIMGLIKFYFCSGSNILQILFIVSCIMILVYGIYALLNKRTVCDTDVKYLIIIFVMLFSITTTFLYSVFVNPDGALFDIRYFTGIVPLAIMILAAGISSVKEFLDKNPTNKNLVSVVICLSTFVLAISYAYTTVTHDINAKSNPIIAIGGISRDYPYEKAAEYIMGQNDIYSADTAVVSTINDGDGYCGLMYLLTQKNKKDAVSLLKNTEIDGDVLKYKKLYICELRTGSPTINKVVLENYKMIAENKDLRIKVFERK